MSQFGKKSAKVNRCLYSSTEQLQMTLRSYMFLKLGLNNEMSLHTPPSSVSPPPFPISPPLIPPSGLLDPFDY